MPVESSYSVACVMFSGFFRSMAIESMSSEVSGAVRFTFHLALAAESGTTSSSVTTIGLLLPCRAVRLSCGVAKAYTQTNEANIIFILFNLY